MLTCMASYGQLSVTTGYTAQQLGNNLAGANITIINPSITAADPNQYGLFNFIGTGLGLSSGVILSTGDVADAVGPNIDNGTSTGYNGAGDPDLTALAGFGTEDAVVLEFEFEVQGDELEFNFVFLSEEYNEYVNTGFNDVFAFYISGPGIVGQENLAVVPGTTTPVTINTINNGSFFQFYNDNELPGNANVNVEFDGFTTKMKARRTGLVPCGVYKLSLRIADGSDDALDSGVLLQENSLVSNSIAVNSSTVSADTTALEGCFPATFTFNLGATATADLNISIRLGGTALNGVDYVHIDSIITIPAGQTSSTVIINALADGITEGRETIELYYSPSSCAPEDTVVLYIDDATSITFDALGTNLNCNGDASGSIGVNIAGGVPPYNVTYIDTLTGISNTVSALSLPITGLQAATYLIKVSDQYGCTADAIVVGGSFNAGQTFLPDGTGVSYTSDITISGFNVGQTLASINQINSICATMEHSYASDLTIELIGPGGQSIQLKNVGTTGSGVNTCDMGEPVASGPVDAWSTSNLTAGVGYQYCWTNTPTYSTMNDMISPIAPGPPPTHTFTTLAGNSYTDYYLPAGSYAPRQSFFGLLGTSLNGAWTLKVTDNFSQDNGYIFDWAISLQADLPDSIVTLLEPPAPTISHTSLDPACGTSTGSIDLTVSGTSPPYSFVWSNGDLTEDIIGLASGSYSVTVTDATGCDYEYTANLSNIGSVTLTENITNESCFGANNGAIDLTTTAGVFTYNWSNGATDEDISALAPGAYIITVTDGSCLAIGSYTIIAAAPIVLTTLITQENCGDQEGAINLTVQGAAATASYSWSTGSTNQDITDLQQGQYLVTVTDGNGCISLDSFTVINLVGNCVPSCDLDITSFLSANENCADATGFVDITVFTTSGPINYIWSNGANTEDLTGLSSGTYSVTVSDAITCIDTMSFTIVNQASGLSISAMNLTSEYCGNSGGAIDAVIVGGSQPYSYLWSNGAITEDISALSGGAYSLTVTDGNGCSYINNATIVNDAGTFAQTYGNAADEVCTNGLGSIDINFSGGQAPYNYTWSNGAVSQDLLGLSAGTYTCTVIDDGGCTITTPSYVVNNDAGTLAFTNVDVDDETCNNSLGEITLSVTGGGIPYAYTWTNGATDFAITGLNGGTYGATVTDNSGCAITTGTLNLANNSGNLSLDAVQAFDEVCGNATGSINIAVSGNSGPLSYVWSNSSASEDLSNLSAGNYNCTITDSVGCAVYANATVNNDPGALSIDNTIIIDETCGQSDGSVDIVISGAAAPSIFLWSNSSITQSITSIQGGTYSVTVTDLIGCTVTGNANVQNNTGTLNLSGQVIVNEICGNNAGSIDVNVSGGTAPLTYLWSNASTAEDLSGLSTGTYTLTVSDALGCDLVAGPYSINNSSGTLTQGTQVVTDEICGNGTGAIDITINGGTPTVTYLWSNAAVTEDLVGLSAGTYTLTVTDGSGCSIIITETVNNNAGSLSISNAQVTDENCTDGAGAIDITISGGAPTYTFTWSNTAVTEDLTSVSQGTYMVTVTDANGCATTGSYNVNNNSPNFQLSSANTTNENCGDGMGSIDVSLIGGTPIFTYAWSNGAITEDISGLSAGVYTGTITDNNGCVVTHSSSIQNDPGSLVVSNDSIVNETCGSNNGSIFLTVANGAPTYTYLWSNGGTTASITGLSGGSYTCIITDAAGCNTNYTGFIQDLGGDLQIVNAATVDDACNQAVGSVSTTVTGGGQPYIYNWSVATANPCCAYVLNMHDLNGNGWGGNPAPFVNVYVNGSLFGSFSVPPGNGNSLNSVSIPVCTGDAISVEYIPANQNDNNTYELMNSAGDTAFADGPDPFSGAIAYTGAVTCTFAGQGTSSISNLYSGNYSLTVTDTNGCSIQGNYTVNNSSGLITATTNSITDETCGQGNGAIDVTVSGASTPTYLWSNGATTESLTGINAGNYMLTATDPGNGCTFMNTYTVINNANGLVVTDTVLTNETCGNTQGGIDLTVTGGTAPISYAWSNGNGTEDIILLGAGVYTVTITDATGCDVAEAYTITNNANGIAASAISNDETCGDGSGTIDMTVSGGTPAYTFNWSNGATTEDLTGLSGGIYDCTITDGATCSFVFTDTVVNLSSSVVINSATINDAVCGDNDGDVTLSLSGGVTPLTFDWSNGDNGQNLNNVTPGSYTLSITEGNGCVLIDSFVVGNTAFGNVTANDTIIVNEICSNAAGSIDIETGGFGNPDYLWSTGSTNEDIFGLPAGTYTVTMTASFGPNSCIGIETFIVLNDQGTLNLDTLIFNDETCSQTDGAIDITVSGGATAYTFNWSNGANTEDLTGLQAGTYSVTVTDANGCIARSTATTLTNNTFGFGVAGAQLTDESCSDAAGAIDLTIAGGTPTYTFLWSSGATTEDLIGLSAGSYDVTVSDNTGCETVASYLIINNTNNFSSSALVTDEGCISNTGAVDLALLGGSPTYTYLWSTGVTTEDINAVTAGTYDVTITDLLGCIITNSYTVNSAPATITNTVNVTAANCTAADGAINITPAGGGTPYTFIWSNGTTTEDLSAVVSGTYSVTISDASSCTMTDSYTVGNSGGGMGISSIPTAATCGLSNGGMAITMINNDSCIYVLNTFDSFGDDWQGAFIEIFVDGVSIGNFTAIDNGSSFNIPVPSGSTIDLVYTSGNFEDENSYNLIEGGITLFSDGPTPATGSVFTTSCSTIPNNYTYLWSNGATASNISGVPAGNYGLTVTDANGCALAVPVTIINIGNPVNLISGDTTDATCGGCSDGSVDLTLDANAAPYTFNWSNGASTEDLVNVVAGTYDVIITDVNGCILDTSFVVNVSTALIQLEGMSLNVYPNPSSGKVYVEFGQDPSEEITIEVFNALGQRVLNKTYGAQSIQERVSIDIDNATAGTYMIKISSNDDYVTKRIVIIKE
jgi:subtilisin-like proprotein convertase family protein